MDSSNANKSVSTAKAPGYTKSVIGKDMTSMLFNVIFTRVSAHLVNSSQGFFPGAGQYVESELVRLSRPQPYVEF